MESYYLELKWQQKEEFPDLSSSSPAFSLKEAFQKLKNKNS